MKTDMWTFEYTNQTLYYLSPVFKLPIRHVLHCK